MKVYFNMCTEDLSNCYVVINEDTKQALIIDPGLITQDVINQIELGAHELCAVLVTHKSDTCAKGIHTLLKIYNPSIYAADTEGFLNTKTTLLKDGTFKAAGLDINYYSMPGSSSDAMVYKIGKFLFTGETIFAGVIGDMIASVHSKRVLIENINKKVFSQEDDTVIMPVLGPPTTVGTEKILATQ